MKDVACEPTGYLALLAAFDCVDDTVLLKKVRLLISNCMCSCEKNYLKFLSALQVVLQELFSSLLEVARHSTGRKVLLYLLAPRDPHYFNNDVVRLLSPGDENANRYL